MTGRGSNRAMEVEDLVRAKEMVKTILRGFDLMSWNQLLSDEVVLKIRLGPTIFNQIRNSVTPNGSVEVVGLTDVKQLLQSIYPELRRGLLVTTELVSGFDVVLLGDWLVFSTKENAATSSSPIVLYIAFDHEGKVEIITIAALDLHPLTEALRAAAQNSAGLAST